MFFDHIKPNKIFSVLTVFLLGFVLYFKTLQSPFLFDDDSFIANNPAIYHLSNMKAIWDFSPMRFIGTLTFAVNYYFHQLNVWGFHLTNIFIHIGTALMVGRLTDLTLSTPRMREGFNVQRREWLAFLIALLFVSHPLATSAINHITQRYTALVALFYIGALCFYIQWRLSGRNYNFICSIILATSAMFTKQSALTLPLTILLYEFCFLGFFKEGGNVLKKRLKSFSILLLIPLIFLCMNFHFYFLTQRVISQSHDWEMVTSGKYLLTQFRVIPLYIKLLFFPVDLNFDYDFPLSQHFFEIPTLYGFLFLCLIVFIGFRSFQRYPFISFGIGWFFITLLIESSIVPIPYVITEYRVYLPLAGFCMLIVLSMYYFIMNFRKILIWMCFILVIFSFLTWEQNKIWQNQILLWQDAVRKSPHKSRPYDNLGFAYLISGNYPQALLNLKKAHDLGPPNFKNCNNLVIVCMQMGRFDLAKEYLNSALRIKPDSIETLNNLGLIYLHQNENEKARQIFEKAIRLNSGRAEPYLNLAKLNYSEGKLVAASQIYEQILSQFPHNQDALILLGELYLQQNNGVKTAQIGQMILNKIDDPKKLTSTASLYAAKGYNNIALQMYLKSLKINTDYAETYLESGKLLGNMNQFDAAISIWKDGAKKYPQDNRFVDLIRQAQALKEKLSVK